MIRKAFTGASFALGNLYNLNASKCRLNILQSKLIYNSIICKTGSYSVQPDVSQEQTPSQLLVDLEKILKAPKMEIKSCIKLLKNLATFYKLNTSDLKNLHSESNFKQFCDKLCNQSKVSISLEKSINILSLLSELNIQMMNPLIIVKFWHQHIDTKMNDLSFRDIEILFVIVLSKMPKIPWKREKMLDLRVELKKRILNERIEKLPIGDIKSALNLMISSKIVNYNVSKVLLNLFRNQEEIDWVEVFKVLGIVNYYLPEFKDLLREARKNIFDGIRNLEHSNLMKILELIRVKISQGNQAFYDAKLIDAIVEKSISENCDLVTGSFILNELIGVNHKHLPFLEYLIKKYKVQKNVHDVKYFAYLLHYSVRLNCESAAFNLLANLNEEKERIKASKDILLKVTYYMGLLNQFDPDLLESLFSRIDFATIDQDFKIKCLISMVKIHYPSFPLSELLKNELEKGIEGNKKLRRKFDSEEFLEESLPLKKSLEGIFGGSEYILTNVKVEYQLKVDHALIFKQDGFPLAVNLKKKSHEEIMFLSEVTIPPESHVVLIKSIPFYGYIINTRELSGSFKSFVKCVEKLNYTIILVSRQEWKKIPDSEKNSWFMEKFTEKSKHIFKNIT